MSFSELIVIFIVAIAILGPQKFPKALINTLKIFKSFKKSLNEIKEDLENEIQLDESCEKNFQISDKFTKNNPKPLTFEEFDAIKSKTLKNNQDFLKKTKNLGCFDENFKNKHLNKNQKEENQQENVSQKINNQLKEQK